MFTRNYRTSINASTLAGMLAAACLSGQAVADTVPFTPGMDGSHKGQAMFEGEMNYKLKEGKSFGTLVLAITNTSNPSNGGYLTGIVFNIDSTDPNASAAFKSSNASHAFGQLAGTGLNAKPFGNGFDAGIAVGKKFSGGGDATKGIAVGETGTFKFKVHAADFASLTAASFLNGPFAHNFIARFRGFNEGSNDKVYASVAHMPVPAPVLLGAAGLVGALGLRRRLLPRGS